LIVLPLSLFCVENRIYLSRGVQVAGVTRQAPMRIMAGVGDLMQMTVDGQTQVEYSVIGRSGGWVMLCAACTMHKETRGRMFLG
jgi:hypothetical protein